MPGHKELDPCVIYIWTELFKSVQMFIKPKILVRLIVENHA